MGGGALEYSLVRADLEAVRWRCRPPAMALRLEAAPRNAHGAEPRGDAGQARSISSFPRPSTVLVLITSLAISTSTVIATILDK